MKDIEENTPNKKISSASAAEKRRKKRIAERRAAFIHLIIITLILIIAIVGVVKLVLWNKGTKSDYDPNEISTEFDTEPEDYVAVQDPNAPIPEDDGITSILLLGNGALAKTKGEADGIGMRLQELTDGKVYDASLDHTYLSVKNTVFEEDYPADVFSLYWISYCLTSGDFQLLEDYSKKWDGDDTVAETVDMLKNLDLNTIDVITIMYDYHDYEDGRLLTGPYDEAMAASCCGCLLQSIRLFHQSYPHIRVIVSSPYFCFVEDGDEKLQPGSTYDHGQGTLADYMIAYKNIAVNANASFVDNYFGTITEDNHKEYLEEGKQRLNAKGRDAIAKRIASFIS